MGGEKEEGDGEESEEESARNRHPLVWIFVITCVFDRLSLDILSRTRCYT